MKTILFENGRTPSRATVEFVSSIDTDYVEINSEIEGYLPWQDFYLFALLINPELKTIVTSSSFEMPLDYRCAMHVFKKSTDEDGNLLKQLDYYAYMIYHAAYYRKKHGLDGLVIKINYCGCNFLKDLQSGELGYETKTYLMLLMRHCEGCIKLEIYTSYKLFTVINNENDLKLDLNDRPREAEEI